MEFEELEVESRLLTTTQHETLNKSNVINNTKSNKNDVKTDENDHVQLESLFIQTEDCSNLINTETYLESNNASTTNKTVHHTSSQSYVTQDTTQSLEKTQNHEIVNDTKLRSTNLEDAESTDSTCIQYDWSSTPRLLCVATEEYQPTNLYENFTKGCQWSPDGTCLLVPSEDYRLRIYDLPREFYSGQIPFDFKETHFTPALTVKEGGLIYDTCWYPFMNSWNPATCCFLSTSRESPIHLWDAFTGELRATYRAYNQVDEVEASISVQFVDSGKEIWCGFKNAVRTFDTDRPGRQTNTMQFKHDFPNMTGLVSCIRENPIMSGLIAFGTYSKCIGLYKDGPLCTFKTGSGVTQIEFSACGTKLFSVVRKNSEFLCWDLRNPGNILYSLGGRQSNTNQRIQFNITPDTKRIISGDVDGNIIVWELPEITDYNEDLSPKYKII